MAMNLTISTQSNKDTIPHINEATFLSVLWIAIGLSWIFVTARLVMRFKLAPQCRVDDVLVLTAALLSLANTSLWSIVYKQLFFIGRLDRGKITSVPANIDWVLTRYLRAQLAGYLLSYTSLWSVKFSFLFFFRQLGERYRLQQIIWWTVLVLVILTYGENCQSAHSVWYERVSLKVSTSMDIISDAAIILVSGNVLWRVKIDWRRKIALVGFSLLTAFIITVAFIRMLVGMSGLGILDPIWLIFWNAIEICVAIVVACLASFRTLYTISRRSKERLLPYTYGGGYTSRSTDTPILLASRVSAEGKDNPYGDANSSRMPSGDSRVEDSAVFQCEQRRAGIYVRRDFQTSESRKYYPGDNGV